MKIIDYSATEKIIEARRIDYNNSLPKTKDTTGREIISKENKPLRANAMRTAMALIKIHSSLQYKANKLGISERGDWIETNRPQIEQMTGYNSKTIYNHINRLIGAGIIITKKNKRPRPLANGKYQYQNFELVMAKKYIVLAEKLTRKEATEAYENAKLDEIENEIVSEPKKTDYPHSHTIKNKNLEANAVENGIPFSGNVFFQPEKIETEKAKEHEPNLNDAKEQEPSAGQPEKISGAALLSLSFYFSQIIYQYAMKRLYSHFTFASLQEQKKVISIFYKLLSAAKNEKTMRAWFNEWIWRVELRAMWHERDESRKGKIAAPSVYFDPKNERGFMFSKKLYLDNPKNKLTEFKESLPTDFENIISVFQLKNERRKANEYFKEPTLKNYNSIINYYRKKNDEPAAHRFNQLVTTPGDLPKNTKHISSLLKNIIR